MKDTLYVPAMTSVFPVNGTLKQKISFLNRQIKELQEQKKCYDKMITERKRAIKNLRK
jgi:cell division protein FtsB